MFYLNSMVRNSTGHGDDWYNLNTFILYLNSMVRSSTGYGDDWDDLVIGGTSCSVYQVILSED